jgi:hypothetical protein
MMPEKWSVVMHHIVDYQRNDTGREVAHHHGGMRSILLKKGMRRRIS